MAGADAGRAVRLPLQAAQAGGGSPQAAPDAEPRNAVTLCQRQGGCEQGAGGPGHASYLRKAHADEAGGRVVLQGGRRGRVLQQQIAQVALHTPAPPAAHQAGSRATSPAEPVQYRETRRRAAASAERGDGRGRLAAVGRPAWAGRRAHLGGGDGVGAPGEAGQRGADVHLHRATQRGSQDQGGAPLGQAGASPKNMAPVSHEGCEPQTGADRRQCGAVRAPPRPRGPRRSSGCGASCRRRWPRGCPPGRTSSAPTIPPPPAPAPSTRGAAAVSAEAARPRVPAVAASWNQQAGRAGGGAVLPGSATAGRQERAGAKSEARRGWAVGVPRGGRRRGWGPARCGPGPGHSAATPRPRRPGWPCSSSPRRGEGGRTDSKLLTAAKV